MDKRQRLRLYDVQRGEILRQLVECYPRRLNRKSILNLVDLANCPVLDEDLAFHLHWLRDLGYIELEFSTPQVGEDTMILKAWATAKGINRVDQRGAGDDGVRT